jgi:murein DD-endopeptidase MepM/ murein hydrolase activator NlpD
MDNPNDNNTKQEGKSIADVLYEMNIKKQGEEKQQKQIYNVLTRLDKTLSDIRNSSHATKMSSYRAFNATGNRSLGSNSLNNRSGSDGLAESMETFDDSAASLSESMDNFTSITKDYIRASKENSMAMRAFSTSVRGLHRTASGLIGNISYAQDRIRRAAWSGVTAPYRLADSLTGGDARREFGRNMRNQIRQGDTTKEDFGKLMSIALGGGIVGSHARQTGLSVFTRKRDEREGYDQEDGPRRKLDRREYIDRAYSTTGRFGSAATAPARKAYSMLAGRRSHNISYTDNNSRAYSYSAPSNIDPGESTPFDYYTTPGHHLSQEHKEKISQGLKKYHMNKNIMTDFTNRPLNFIPAAPTDTQQTKILSQIYSTMLSQSEFMTAQVFGTSLTAMPTRTRLGRAAKKAMATGDVKGEVYQASKIWMDDFKDEASGIFNQLAGTLAPKKIIGYAFPSWTGAGFASDIPNPAKSGLMGSIYKLLGLLYISSRFSARENNFMLYQIGDYLREGFKIDREMKKPRARGGAEALGKAVRRKVSSYIAKKKEADPEWAGKSAKNAIIGGILYGQNVYEGAKSTYENIRSSKSKSGLIGVMNTVQDDLKREFDPENKKGIFGKTRGLLTDEKTGWFPRIVDKMSGTLNEFNTKLTDTDDKKSFFGIMKNMIPMWIRKSSVHFTNAMFNKLLFPFHKKMISFFDSFFDIKSHYKGKMEGKTGAWNKVKAGASAVYNKPVKAFGRMGGDLLFYNVLGISRKDMALFDSARDIVREATKEYLTPGAAEVVDSGVDLMMQKLFFFMNAIGSTASGLWTLVKGPSSRRDMLKIGGITKGSGGKRSFSFGGLPKPAEHVGLRQQFQWGGQYGPKEGRFKEAGKKFIGPIYSFDKNSPGMLNTIGKGLKSIKKMGGPSGLWDEMRGSYRKTASAVASQAHDVLSGVKMLGSKGLGALGGILKKKGTGGVHDDPPGSVSTGGRLAISEAPEAHIPLKNGFLPVKLDLGGGNSKSGEGPFAYLQQMADEQWEIGTKTFQILKLASYDTPGVKNIKIKTKGKRRFQDVRKVLGFDLLGPIKMLFNTMTGGMSTIGPPIGGFVSKLWPILIPLLGTAAGGILGSLGVDSQDREQKKAEQVTSKATAAYVGALRTAGEDTDQRRIYTALAKLPNMKINKERGLISSISSQGDENIFTAAMEEELLKNKKLFINMTPQEIESHYYQYISSGGHHAGKGGSVMAVDPAERGTQIAKEFSFYISKINRAKNTLPAATGSTAAPAKSAVYSNGRKTANTVYTSNGFNIAYPTETKLITSGIGETRIRPQGRGIHQGVDVRAYKGQQIYAVMGGVVSRAGGGTHNTLVVDQADGTKARYIHMDSIIVNKGDRVSAGQLLGLSGNAGMIDKSRTAAHLHLEILKDGKAIDPEAWFAGYGLGFEKKPGVNTTNPTINTSAIQSTSTPSLSSNKIVESSGDSTPIITKTDIVNKFVADKSHEAQMNGLTRDAIQQLNDGGQQLINMINMSNMNVNSANIPSMANTNRQSNNGGTYDDIDIKLDKLFYAEFA